MIVGINDALKAIAYALLVLFFVIGVMKTCGSFTELKRPEVAFKCFIRFVLAQAAVTYGMELMTALFSIAQGAIQTIMGASGLTAMEAPMVIQSTVFLARRETDLVMIRSIFPALLSASIWFSATRCFVEVPEIPLSA